MSNQSMTRGQQRRNARRTHGFTLIELVVAMLLGLIVIGGVSSVFLAGQQTYRTNEALGDVEDGSRTAFELLSRDIRNAGLTGCDDTSGRIANVINPNSSGNTYWYANWNYALQGFDDASTDPALTGITGDGTPVKGTSSIELLSTASSDVVVTWNTSNGSGSPGNFAINAPSSLLATGQIIMVCDFNQATILQITSYSGNQRVIHNSGSGTPGNCTKGMGLPVVCSANGNNHDYANNGRVAILTAVDWYIGTSSKASSGKSLYRLTVSYSSGSPTFTPVEMVRNVTGMTINYLQSSGTPSVGVMPGALPGTGFVTATNVTNWANVYAAQATLTVQSSFTRASVNATPLSRPFTSTTAVRNRTP